MTQRTRYARCNKQKEMNCRMTEPRVDVPIKRESQIHVDTRYCIEDSRIRLSSVLDI